MQIAAEMCNMLYLEHQNIFFHFKNASQHIVQRKLQSSVTRMSSCSLQGVALNDVKKMLNYWIKTKLSWKRKLITCFLFELKRTHERLLCTALLIPDCHLLDKFRSPKLLQMLLTQGKHPDKQMKNSLKGAFISYPKNVTDFLNKVTAKGYYVIFSIFCSTLTVFWSNTAMLWY